MVASSVSPTANRISPVRPRAAPRAEPPAMKNMVISAINVGKRPLQGTRLLVMMASSRSLGELMIRHPTTPAALQPKPMAMVRACRPQEPQRQKGRSRL